MNPWLQLNQWAESGQSSISIVLMDEPGLTAALEKPGEAAMGPLCGADFWAADWAGALKAATAKQPPDGGLCLTVGGRRYYVSGLHYPRSALVLGAGHVGRAVCQLLRFVNFEVTVVDDRPEFLRGFEEGVHAVEAKFEALNRVFPKPHFQAAIIVTRGHASDTACLRQILDWPRTPLYLGMIGSRKRAAETMAMLAAEGCMEEKLARAHSPIGLAIGAQTPPEIAVAIVAELLQEFMQKSDP